jgi:hypothetical protein
MMMCEPARSYQLGPSKLINSALSPKELRAHTFRSIPHLLTK